jgi:predicted nucleotidyltransferase
MLTQNAAIETVRKYVKEINEMGINLRQAIMFGSFAKGTQHEYSDIDVALVADNFSGVGFLDRQYFSSIGIKKTYNRIEPITYPTDYFYNSDPFIEEIKKEGILIFS